MLSLNIRKKIFSYINKKILTKKTAIAFSGGIDSSILLKICENKKIYVIHVNHNLNKNSKNWAIFCKKKAKKKKLKIKVLSIKIKKKYIKKYGLEGASRILRYKKISDYMKKKSIKNLITAHHFDDYIETYLLNIFRGCGLRGLRGLKKKKKIFGLTIYRPLLGLTRNELIKLFKKPKKFIKDPSNNDKKIKRNLIRYILKKYIYKNFPSFKNIISRNIKNFIGDIKILNIVALKDIKSTKMSIKKISILSEERIKNLFVFILKKRGIDISSTKWLNELVKQLRSKKKKMIIKKGNVMIYLKNGIITIDENKSS
ncbi:tRNA lysidine(34) synthetase TilS [Candidatus Vidania fulgoroideorum]